MNIQAHYATARWNLLLTSLLLLVMTIVFARYILIAQDTPVNGMDVIEITLSVGAFFICAYERQQSLRAYRELRRAYLRSKWSA